MGVDTSTGFITSDDNKFSPAPPPRSQPQFDIAAYLAGREDTQPSGFNQPVPSMLQQQQVPVESVPEDVSPPQSIFVPNLGAAPSAPVSFNPETQFTFEEYLAQLGGGQGGGMVAPPPVAPIAGAPSFGMSPGMDQGIGSLVPPPVIAPLQLPQMQPPPMAGGGSGGRIPRSAYTGGLTPPILYFGPDGQPVYGGIA